MEGKSLIEKIFPLDHKEVKMKKRGKRYNEALSKLEKGKLYTKEEACKLGVYIHGMAGDIAAEQMTEIGMTSGDIVNALPLAWKKITETR